MLFYHQCSQRVVFFSLRANRYLGPGFRPIKIIVVVLLLLLLVPVAVGVVLAVTTSTTCSSSSGGIVATEGGV